jgi:serine/threonine-protein kinase
MELQCTRPTCPKPLNRFPDLDDTTTLKSISQKYCITCGMPQILAGRYLPLKLLGRGGFGAAFLAIDRYTPTMRQCVVKQFQPSGNLTPDQLQLAHRLFEREAEVLESLGNRHPQIPNLLAFFELDVSSRTPGETERFFYLVQEYIDGKNMEELLEQQGAMPEAEVTQMLEAILKVLQFVHDNGSIHRDIKPSNIMRHRDGQYFLLDFGAVKQVTATASIAGQPPGRSTGIYSRGFAPPEQMSGSVVYPATDLYALAVTCITLLTGQQPHDLFDPLSNSFNWRSKTQVSDRLAAILNRLLLPAPNQRFQSAEQVLDALHASAVQPALPRSQPASTPAPTPSPSPPAQPTPAPLSPSAPPTPASPLPASSRRQPFSLLEIIGGAAFTGFEGGLVAIVLTSLLGTAITPIFWILLLGIMGGMIFAQNRRLIEKVDLVLIALASLLVVLFVPGLSGAVSGFADVVGSRIGFILVTAGFAALLAISITIVFRLIYNLLSRLL